MSTTTKKKTAKSFSYRPQNELPKLSKIKTEWRLDKLFYSSPTDPQLENDVVEMERVYTAFAKRYGGKTEFTKTDTALHKSLVAYRKLHDTRIERVFVYLFLCREKNARDTKAEQLLNQLQQRATAASNLVVFYELALAKLPKKRQKQLLRDEHFAPFAYLLKQIFDAAKYQLSEAEEKILSLKSLPARSLWIAGTEKILNQATIIVGKETMPLNGALMEMLDAPKQRRRALWKGCVSTLEEIAPVAENELNALVLDKKISDELRGYTQPYSATVRAFDTTEQSLAALVEAVTTDGYALSKRFYRSKAKLLGQNKLPYLERDDFPKRLPSVTFAVAVEICRDAFYGFSPQYGEIFDEMLQNGHIDVFPHNGKGGGAFSINGTHCPTMVMLNHSSDFMSLRTLAHEMGHAIHSYRSKTQDVLYQDYSTVAAETASTFFEAVVANSLMQQMTDAQRTIYLNSLISDKIATMIMCIARYRAELEIHETIRETGAMTWQDMSKTLAKHFRQYCGPAVEVDDEHGLNIVAKTHYRRNFYQFSYSYGVIASSIMFARYLKDPSYVTQVDQFLSAGSSGSVDDIFASIGIDTTKPEVFQEGITMLAEEIKTFAKLVSAKK